MLQPEYEDDGVCLYCGDCIEVMRALPQNSVDTIITDPPYHLTQALRNGSSRKPGTGPFGRVHVGKRGFMGKTWDGGGIAFDPKLWATALRVAKPGAMLMAFGGTRTFHRLTCAIEDAGWEIRDCVMWVYGSGFPKSLDMSKAIDKAAGAERTEVIGDKAETDPRWNSDTTKPRMPPEKGWNANSQIQPGRHCPARWITAPATDAAKPWDGWGTALKPAWEPIIVAMKPLDGTFAQNALKHGVAGINVDGCRIGLEKDSRLKKGGSYSGNRTGSNAKSAFNPGSGQIEYSNPPGRWPTNVLLAHAPDCRFMVTKRVKGNPTSRMFHDAYTGKSATKFLRGVSHQGNQHAGSDGNETVEAWDCHPDCPVRLLDKQAGQLSKSGDPRRRDGVLNSGGMFGAGKAKRLVQVFGDSGGASRFFYCAKASKTERNLGLPADMRNDHPTVKPLQLMEYLCKLTATPTGGMILDPFAGSGTTLLAARKMGRECIGIETNPDYVTLAQERLKGGRYAKPCSKHCTQFCTKHSK